MIPLLSVYLDIALLLMRIMVAVVFIYSGWQHVADSDKRSKDIGMPKGITIFLGLAEVAGGLGVGFGVLTQLAALGLILIMLGAIAKKAFQWKTGFWGRDGQGWNYDLLFVVMNLVILTANGGRYTLWM
jgi:putative oxidoreductase